jgi:hypothetical protein
MRGDAPAGLPRTVGGLLVTGADVLSVLPRHVSRRVVMRALVGL